MHTSLISCPHCGQALEIAHSSNEQQFQCAYCKGFMVLPSQPVQPDAPPLNPQSETAAGPNPLNLDLASQQSISVQLEGMYRGRYLMNHKKVLVKFKDGAFEASTYSLSIGVLILLIATVITLVCGVVIGSLAMLGVGGGKPLLEDFPAMTIVKFGGLPVVLLLIFSMYYIGTKLGRKESIRVAKRQIHRVRKGVGKAGDFVVRIDFDGGRVNLSVPKERESQLRQFILANTGSRIK